MRLKSEYVKLTANKRLHGLELPIVGVTGGIASGKSTFCSQLANMKNFDIPILSADRLIKKIYGQKETLDFIGKNFTACMDTKNNSPDFKKLRQEAFKSKESREKLESFLYQRMPAAFKEELKKYSNPQTVIYDVPLLFEKSLDQGVDLSVCIYCSRETMKHRLMARDEIDEELAAGMLASQLSIEEKKKRADVVIENVGSTQELAAAARDFSCTFLK